jgi:RimJ/RimL family protein N-acetyltransferase
VRPGDAAVLVAGRDDEARRWLGPGDPDPTPSAVVLVGGEIVGWVDADAGGESGHSWLGPGDLNLGYSVFPAHRGQGCASRAVQQLLHRLALEEGAAGVPPRRATLLIDRGNARSLALAARLGFPAVGEVGASTLFARPVPPLSYTDGVVRIRRQSVDDLDADLAAKDDEQVRWMWRPGERERWEAMSPGEQRAHARAGLAANRAAFGRGPKWTFAVDLVGGDEAVEYVAYVDADLANEQVPRGEANISYSAHPGFRGRGHVSRAVRLLLRFLAEHTGARQAHILVDPRNEASLRVAVAVGARPAAAAPGELIRHVVPISRER